MRVELGLVGVVLAALAGFLVGTLIEHPPGPGGLQFIGALIGATVALAALMIGESLKSPAVA